MLMEFSHKDLGMRLRACNPSILDAEDGCQSKAWLMTYIVSSRLMPCGTHQQSLPLGDNGMRIRSQSWLHLVQKQIELHETLFKKNHK